MRRGAPVRGVPSTASTAVPTWFGPGDRPLFGWVHVPDRPDGRGAVLCPSLGLEGEASQLAYRSLARELADAGCAVVRFDYHGTGDSAGRLDEPGRVEEWVADVAVCCDELRDAGVTSLHLVGTRLGATLAARAVSACGPVDSLTLWYPWTRGNQFLRYQRALRRLYATGDAPGSDDGLVEIPGFVVGAELAADLKALDTGRGDLVLPDSVLVVDAADPDTGEVSRGEFGPDGCVRRSGTGVDRLFGVELMRATVDAADLAAIVDFVRSAGRPVAPAAVEPAIRAEAEVASPDGVVVRERAVLVGPAGLFGILAEPVRPPTDHHLGRVRTSGGPVPGFRSALFLNAGSLHHVGPGRQWVELSRHWAAAGMRCLRMDIGGVGDSPATGPAGELSSYPPAALGDVEAGVAYLAPEDPGEVVLLGLCAGAYHAILAAPSTRVGGVAVLNPLRLPSPDPGDGSLGELIDGAPVDGWADADGASAAPEPPSRRFLGGLRDRGVFRPVTRHLPDRVWWLARVGRGGSDPVASLRHVVDAGASLLVILGPDEWPGIGRGRTHQYRRLAKRGVFAITYVPTLDHSFHVASGRRAALAVLNRWVLGTDGTGPPSDTRTIA